MSTMRNTEDCRRTAQLNVGACDYLADMILEAQQMALRLGAAGVSTKLQSAYLETHELRRQLAHKKP